VLVVRDFAALREAVHDWPDIREWVVQEYVHRPLLFRRRKFHLRAYVLAGVCSSGDPVQGSKEWLNG
jgi:hypothetical protein